MSLAKTAGATQFTGWARPYPALLEQGVCSRTRVLVSGLWFLGGEDGGGPSPLPPAYMGLLTASQFYCCLGTVSSLSFLSPPGSRERIQLPCFGEGQDGFTAGKL